VSSLSNSRNLVKSVKRLKNCFNILTAANNDKKINFTNDIKKETQQQPIYLSYNYPNENDNTKNNECLKVEQLQTQTDLNNKLLGLANIALEREIK
jgi:hypothetical protein